MANDHVDGGNEIIINDFNYQEFVDKISEWMQSKGKWDFFHCYLTDNIFIINAEGYNTLPYDSLKFLISNVPQYLKKEIGRIGFQTVLKEVKQNRNHAFYHDRSTDPGIVELKAILAELKEKQPDEAKLDDNPHKR